METMVIFRCVLFVLAIIAAVVIIVLNFQAGKPQSETDKKLERMEKESRR